MNSEEIFNNIKNQDRKTVRAEFDTQEFLKSIGLDKTQDIDKSVADQKIEPQYVDMDKPKFVQPERRSYFVAGNANNNEINTTAQRPNEIEYEADVVDDEKKKDNYFGLSKLKTNKVDIVKNALKYVVQAPNLIQNAANTIGALKGKSGEDVAMEGVRGFAGSTVDFASSMLRFFGQNYMYFKGYKNEQLDKITNLGNVVTGGEDFSDDIKQKYTDFYNRIDRQTQEFKDKTERFLQYTGIGKTDKDGFIYDLVGGAASLLYAIGATVVTKSPAAAAEIFGAYQYQSLYEEGIEKGFSPLKARTIGVAGGAAEGALELVGLHVLIETLAARKSFAKILKSAATEFIQEASQQGAEEILATTSGMRTESVSEILANVGYAGLIGALIGGGSATISNTRFVQKMISDSATKELINIGVKDEYAKQMVNNMLNFSVSPQVADELSSMLKDEQSPVTYKNADPRETYKEFGDTVKKALDPAQKRGVELEFIDEKKKFTDTVANALINSGRFTQEEAYKQAEAQANLADGLARIGFEQDNIRPSEYYKRFKVDVTSGNIETDERNVDEDNPFVDVSFDPVDFDDQARAEYEAAMDAEQDYMDQVEKENKTTLKKEARILGDMGIGAIRRPTAQGYGKERWSEYNDLSPRIKNYFFTDTETAMSWDEAEDLLAKSGNSIKDLFEYLAAVDNRAVTLNQLGVFNRVLQKEKEAIKQQAIADGTFLKAPNGKDSNLPEQLWLTVRTKAFKNWFGDWLNDPQNASKVVDENGEPLVVYHGTANNFRVFDKNKSYQGLFWFSNDYNKVNAGYDGAAGKGIVMPVFLNIKNVADWDLYDKYSPEELENMKYDGLLLKDGNETVAVAFDNKQIKSINNRGIFDRRNPDIYLQVAYHGTPYKFEKFSLNNVGTGEGAASHGWGLYFAKDKKVSDFYKFKLTPKTAELFVDPKDFSLNDKYHYYTRDGKFYVNGYDTNEQEKEISKAEYGKALKEAQEINRKAMEKDEKVGQLFKVNIPEDDVLLDEQKYFNEQPKKVQKALKKIADNLTDEQIENLGYNSKNPQQREAAKKFLKDMIFDNNVTGQGIYETISDLTGGNIKEASLLLNKYGVKGITYDGRQDGRGYVIFDDNAVDVVETFYQPAYHGTPHRFDTFSTDKIGTGEGAQAHGWGLYFAGDKKVSERYRRRLSDFSFEDKNGEIDDELVSRLQSMFSIADKENEKEIERIAKERIKEYAEELKETIDKNKKRIEIIDLLLEKLKDTNKTFEDFYNSIPKDLLNTDIFNKLMPVTLKDYLLKDIKEIIWLQKNNNKLWGTKVEPDGVYIKDELEQLKIANKESIRLSSAYLEKINKIDLETLKVKQGQLFQVDIPEDDVLLDEQKTFDEQPKKVKEGLRKLINNFGNYSLKKNNDGEYDVYDGKKFIDTYDNEEDAKKAVKENNVASMTANINSRVFDILYFRNKDLFNPKGDEIIQTAYYKFQEDPEKYFYKMWDKLSGKNIYEILSYLYRYDKEASLKLNEVGIKGIKYHGGIDGQAYVVFDDKAVKVLEKYYQDQQEQQQQEQPRGATTVFDRQYFINLFSTADKSTLMHEMAHAWLSEINYFASAKNATNKVLDIKKQLDNWLGVPDNNGRYSVEQQEKFAQNFEIYLKEGKAPTAKLKTVFARFKTWLSEIYDRIKDELPKLNDDVRELFDSILSRSYDVPDSNIYAGKESAIKEVIKNIQEGRASEVDGITIDDVYNLLNVAYTRKPSRPSKNLKQLLNDKNIYDFNELTKAGADTVLQILKDGGYVKEDATTEQALELARQALDGKPIYRLADQWRVAGDIDFARNLRVLEKVIEFSQIDSVMEKILTLQEEGYRNVEQGDVEQVKDEYKRLMSADVKEAKKIVEDIINRLHKKRFIDRAAQKQMIVDLNFSSTVEEIKESVLNVIEDLQDEIKLVKEQLRNPRKPIVRKDKTIPPGKNATEEEKNNYKKYMRKLINRLLKQVLPSKQNNNKVSKFGNVEIQRFFEELIRINKMSREEAERFAMDRIAKDNEWILKDEKGEGFENKQKIINMFVSYKSKIITQNSPELLKELYDNLQKINIAGRNEKQINDYLTKAKRNKDMDELLDNIEKNGSKNKVSNWIKTFYNYSVANWYSCINSIAGEKQAEKDVLELYEKNASVKAKAIQDRIVKRTCDVLGLKTRSQFDKKIHDYLKEKYEFIQNKIDHNGNEVQRKQTLNKMELICCYIWAKNKQLKERIIRAYGNEQFNEMMAKLDKYDMSWGDIIQEETASLYDDVNKVYVKMYGLDMPQSESYFPSSTERIQGNMDLLKDAIIQTSSPSFIKGRIDSNLIIMKFGNPINIAFNHIFKASRYAVMQEKLADIYKTYLHPDVSDKLKDVYGSDKIFNYIKKMLDNIKFENFTAQVDIVNSIFDHLANTYVITRIAGKPSIMIKQLLSFTNYMEDVDSALWLKHFGKMVANPSKFKQIKEFMYEHSPYLKQRYESGSQNEALEKAMEGQANALLRIKSFKGFLSIMTRVGDIGAIIFGGYPMIQAQLEKGVPIEKAFENFEKATLRSQQANFSSTLSNWQNYVKQNPLLRAIFAFANTPTQYTRKLVDVCYKMAHGDEKFIKGKGFKTLALYGIEQSFVYTAFTSLALLNGLVNGDWDDLKDDVWLSLFQVSNFLGIPILGQVYNQAVSMFVTGNFVQDKRVPIIDDMTDFFKAVKKAYDNGLGDMDVKDWIDTTDKLASITTGVPIKTLYNTWISSWADIINGDYGKGFVKLYGATESRANKIFD